MSKDEIDSMKFSPDWVFRPNQVQKLWLTAIGKYCRKHSKYKNVFVRNAYMCDVCFTQEADKLIRCG